MLPCAESRSYLSPRFDNGAVPNLSQSSGSPPELGGKPDSSLELAVTPGALTYPVKLVLGGCCASAELGQALDSVGEAPAPGLPPHAFKAVMAKDIEGLLHGRERWSCPAEGATAWAGSLGWQGARRGWNGPPWPQPWAPGHRSCPGGEELLGVLFADPISSLSA